MQYECSQKFKCRVPASFCAKRGYAKPTIKSTSYIKLCNL